MLAAVKGYYDGTRIVMDEEVDLIEGQEVVVTLLDYPGGKKRKEIDWDSFVIPSERGQDVDGYMKEMRENDRL